jgi:HD-GYP domain-containing protein (c-di-GMP phosphodiesterase class II)
VVQKETYFERRWWTLLTPRSLTRQITLALIVLFSAAACTVGFTVYELGLRKHDYVILSLAGQLRALAQGMVNGSLHFRKPDAGMGSDEQAALFLDGLREQSLTFDNIVTAFQRRYLEPELTGRSDPLVCSWDERSIAQLNLTAQTWQAFQDGMAPVFEPSPSRAQLERSADYIIENAGRITEVAKDLSGAFQLMMEGKMRLVALFNQLALGLFFIAIIVLLTLLYFTFVKPLRTTLAGIDRISQGDFGYRIPLSSGNEIGAIARAFNSLSLQLSALFRLTERINRAGTLDETLRFIFAEFRSLLPLDWVGMLALDESGERFVLQRRYTEGGTALNEGDLYRAADTRLERAFAENRPLHIPDLAQIAADEPEAEFAAALCADGRRSALFFPLAGEGDWSAVLAFAVSEVNAYNRDHLELLGNIAGQVTHGFEKTVVTENLVVSAVTGFAKLAESRDSETGDHLIRMARYAALIAEEMNREGLYTGKLPPEWVRDIFRFAPMHDIGKVGVEDSILLKPGALDEAERREMERHPVIGGEVLRRCEEQMNAVGHTVFQMGIEIAECHHEKFDGSGYPQGLKGEAIPLSARIVAAADVFDALTSKRPYKEAWPVDKALLLFEREIGGHFDPRVVAAMQRTMPGILEVYRQLKHV